MSADKRSIVDVLGIPKEFGVLLLTLVLILAISPYLGGIDLGIFRVPDLPPRATWVLRYLGPVLVVLVLLLFLPCLQHHRNPQTSPVRAVETDSKYCLQSIADIVKAEAANHGVHIDGLRIGDRLHINDVERICAKAWFPEKSAAEISSVLQSARAMAFSRKYAEPREDEKLVDVSKIKIDDLKPWEAYFTDLLRDLGVEDPNQLDILNVGIGNGHAEEPFLSQIHSFKAVDISEEALQYARKKYPQMTPFVCSAEDLNSIPNNSVDLYLSLRTYQSTLFDRRAALHEAYRVLRNGGIILLSVPIMFLRRDDEVLTGLIPPESSEPNMEYARQLVGRIQEYLRILNFRDVTTDERSPFEIFLCARR
jgi:SAM-dependent methyltransferase